MSEELLQGVLVWGLVGSAMLQAAVHGYIWHVLRPQRDRTSVGTALKFQMLWQSVAFTCSIGFHVLLALVVTTGDYGLPFWLRLTIYLVVMATAVVASWFGVNLVVAIRRPPPGEMIDKVDDDVTTANVRY